MEGNRAYAMTTKVVDYLASIQELHIPKKFIAIDK